MDHSGGHDSGWLAWRGRDRPCPACRGVEAAGSKEARRSGAVEGRLQGDAVLVECEFDPQWEGEREMRHLRAALQRPPLDPSPHAALRLHQTHAAHGRCTSLTHARDRRRLSPSPSGDGAPSPSGEQGRWRTRVRGKKEPGEGSSPARTPAHTCGASEASAARPARLGAGARRRRAAGGRAGAHESLTPR